MVEIMAAVAAVVAPTAVLWVMAVLVLPIQSLDQTLDS
jgi:hypothetical protein